MNHTSRHQRIPFIRRAKAMATVAVVTATAVLASTTSPAFADQIRQGETITIDWCSSNWVVNPSNAGTIEIDNSGSMCRSIFRASPTYLGPANLYDGDIGFFLEVTPDESASIGATFTPTAAPGPCLQIVSGDSVNFGDITPGQAVLSESLTDVQSCAVVDVTLTAAVSPATSGTTVWQPDREHGLLFQDLNPNSFAYQMNSLVDGTQFFSILDTVPSVFVNGFDGSADVPMQPGTTRTFAHTMRIGSGSSGLGQQFSATVTLTATAA
jgi:hypothetical protein